MRARDIMTRPVYTVHPWTTVKEAAAIVTSHQITALPVVDENGHLIGMVSEGDMLWHRVPADQTVQPWRRPDDPIIDPPNTVAEVMSKTVVSMPAASDPADIAQTMIDRDIRSIPIVEGSTVVGILSRRALLRTIIRSDDALTAEIQHRLDEYSTGVRWQVKVADGVVTVSGTFHDDIELHVVRILAQRVPGVSAVHLHRTSEKKPAAPDQPDSSAHRGESTDGEGRVGGEVRGRPWQHAGCWRRPTRGSADPAGQDV